MVSALPNNIIDNQADLLRKERQRREIDNVISDLSGAINEITQACNDLSKIYKAKGGVVLQEALSKKQRELNAIISELYNIKNGI